MSHEEGIADAVSRHGWTCVSVSDRSLPFAYTVGLQFSQDHPELIVFGLPTEGYRVVAAMVEEIRAGRSFADCSRYGGVLVDGEIATRAVHESQHERYLGYAMGYCREHGRIGRLSALQVFWPDRDGRFPFDAGCEREVYDLQPRLDLPLSPSDTEEWRRERGI